MKSVIFATLFALIANLLYQFHQEYITRRVQLPYDHIPVTAFSKTELFLVWIQIPTGALVTNCNQKRDIFTCVGPHCFILTETCSYTLEQAYFAGKYLKIDWSVKMPLHWLIIGVAGSILMAPGFSHFILGIQDTWIISRRFQFHSPVLTYPNGCCVTSQT